MQSQATDRQAGQGSKRQVRGHVARAQLAWSYRLCFAVVHAQALEQHRSWELQPPSLQVYL